MSGLRPGIVIAAGAGGWCSRMLWASPDDMVVDAAHDAAVCVAEGRAAGGSGTCTRTTGDHGDPSNFPAAQVLQFFDAHRTPRTGIRTAGDKSSAIRRP